MAPPAHDRPGRGLWLAALSVTVAMVALHVWLWFHAGAFCGDEVQVINLAQTPLTQMARDSFPVLLPVLVSGWIGAGLADSDPHLRLLGLVVGLGIVGTLWLPAWATRRTPPILSLILFGLNGTAIYWTGYLRAYGLGSLLMLLALAAMIFLLEKPTWWRAGLLAFVAALSVQALYHNVVFFASICLAGWLICWRRQDRPAALKIFAAAMVAALSLLPYLGCVWRWQRAAAAIRPGFSFKAVLDNFNTMLAFPLPQYVWIWALLGLTMALVAIVSFLRSSPAVPRPEKGLTEPEARVFAGIIIVLSLAGYFVFLRFAALITSPWYFLPPMALAAASFDVGICLSNLPRLVRTVVYGILIGTAGLALPFAIRDLNCRFSNMNLVANRLTKEASPQDYIVVTPWHLGISFDRYYRGTAEWDTLPPLADHSTYRFDLLPSGAEKDRANQLVLDRIARVLQTGHRVWVVGWMSVPAPGRSAATAEGRFIAEHSQSFEAVDLKIKGPTSDYENAVLLLASGVKKSSP
jgi:hypothetical protein